MAWYNGTFSCGHEGRVNVIGPMKSRQWKIDRLFSEDCESCKNAKFKEKIAIENEESEKKASEMELPTLTGTVKQIQWANTLRVNFINNVENFVFNKSNDWKCYKKDNLKKLKIEDLLDIVNYIVTNKTESSFFINNRYRDYIEILNQYAPDAIKTDDEIIDEIKSQNMELDNTILPENAEYKGIVKVIATENEIKIEYTKNEVFMKIVKDLGYKWNGMWIRKINEYTGSFKDRAAEVINKLLSKGFIVMIIDDEIRTKAINANYEPECRRWIMYKKDTLCIYWNGYDEKLYSAARSLPGTKWDNPYVTIKVDRYKELDEFVDIYGFKYSNDAVKVINNYKEGMKNISKVNVEKAEEVKEKDGLEEILNSNIEILEDLREED